MSKEQHRHDVSDEIWDKVSPYFPGQKGQWGGIAEDNRLFFNGNAGFYALVRRGAIYPGITGSSVVSTSDLSGFATTGHGIEYWNH